MPPISVPDELEYMNKRIDQMGGTLLSIEAAGLDQFNSLNNSLTKLFKLQIELLLELRRLNETLLSLHSDMEFSKNLSDLFSD